MHSFIVEKKDVAQFETGVVHPVCSTFTLAREIEWSTRLFVLDMLEKEEEGIGTQLSIVHHSPAFVGEEIIIKANYGEIDDEEIICSFEASVDDRLVATGFTGQRILPKAVINTIFEKIKKKTD